VKPWAVPIASALSSLVATAETTHAPGVTVVIVGGVNDKRGRSDISILVKKREMEARNGSLILVKKQSKGRELMCSNHFAQFKPLIPFHWKRTGAWIGSPPGMRSLFGFFTRNTFGTFFAC